MQEWLKPECLRLDYSQFLYRYLSHEDEWVNVYVDNETGGTAWLRVTPSLRVYSWPEFLAEHTTAIEPLFAVDVKESASFESKTIRQSSALDCFEALEVKGDWIRIRSNETLECSEHPSPIKSGWIRWKVDGALAIKYYLSC